MSVKYNSDCIEIVRGEILFHGMEEIRDYGVISFLPSSRIAIYKKVSEIGLNHISFNLPSDRVLKDNVLSERIKRHTEKTKIDFFYVEEVNGYAMREVTL